MLTDLNNYSEILSIEDLMEVLRIGKSSAYTLCRTHAIKAFILKGKWKIPQQSVLEFLNAQLDEN